MKNNQKLQNIIPTLILIFIVILLLAMIISIQIFVLVLLGVQYNTMGSLVLFFLLLCILELPFDFLYTVVWSKFIKKDTITILDKVFLLVGLISVSIATIVIADTIMDSVHMPAIGVIIVSVIISVFELVLYISDRKNSENEKP